MAHVATPFIDSNHVLRAQAVLVLAVTARAWALAPRAAQTAPRRPTRGCEQGRARWRSAAATVLQPATLNLAHSW